jgi:hypothetical protein
MALLDGKIDKTNIVPRDGRGGGENHRSMGNYWLADSYQCPPTRKISVEKS